MGLDEPCDPACKALRAYSPAGLQGVDPKCRALGSMLGGGRASG